jgi:hypothetical protein
MQSNPDKPSKNNHKQNPIIPSTNLFSHNLWFYKVKGEGPSAIGKEMALPHQNGKLGAFDRFECDECKMIFQNEVVDSSKLSKSFLESFLCNARVKVSYIQTVR